MEDRQVMGRNILIVVIVFECLASFILLALQVFTQGSSSTLGVLGRVTFLLIIFAFMWKGYSWARMLFAGLSFLGGLAGAAGLVVTVFINQIPITALSVVFLLVWAIISFGYLAIGVVLFTSKSVKDFMSYQHSYIQAQLLKP